MTKKQAKARAHLLRQVGRLHFPIERLFRAVMYAEPRRSRNVPSMFREIERVRELLLGVEWAVKDWRRS